MGWSKSARGERFGGGRGNDSNDKRWRNNAPKTYKGTDNTKYRKMEGEAVRDANRARDRKLLGVIPIPKRKNPTKGFGTQAGVRGGSYEDPNRTVAPRTPEKPVEAAPQNMGLRRPTTSSSGSGLGAMRRGGVGVAGIRRKNNRKLGGVK